MSENSIENPQAASQVEQLVRPDSNVNGHADISAQQLQMQREISVKMGELSAKWTASSESEPNPSPRYMCRLASGENVICNRNVFDGIPSWIHNNYVQGGVTHWREFK